MAAKTRWVAVARVVLTLLASSCASTPSGTHPPPPIPELPANFPSGCRYLRVFVYWQGGMGGFDKHVQELVGNSYIEALEAEGFEVVGEVADAHFLSSSVASRNVEEDLAFVWHVDMRFKPSLAEGEVKFAAGFMDAATLEFDLDDLRANRFLIQMPFADLSSITRAVASSFATTFRERAIQLCRDLVAGLRAEEERLERLRLELVEEIERVRQQRIDEQQRKQLELEVLKAPAQ